MLFKNVKEWAKVAGPSGKLLFWEIVFASIERLSLVATILPAAKIISSITIIDYKAAASYACLVAALVFVYCVFASISSAISSKQEKRIYFNCESDMLNKVLATSKSQTDELAKQKIINIMTTNVATVSKFSGELSAWVGNMLGLLFVFGLLFAAHFLLGLIALGVSLFCMLLYNIIGYFEAKVNKKQTAFKDTSENLLFDLIAGKEIAKDFNLEENLYNIYNSSNINYFKAQDTSGRLNNLRKIWLYFVWQGCILGVTIYMIYLLRLDFLTLSLFIICLPYLNETLNNVMNCYSLLYKARTAKDSALRVNTILQLEPENVLVFGKNTSDNIAGNLLFTGVYENASLIKYLSFGAKKGEITNIIASKEPQKDAIIALLRRTISVTKGTITLDGISIYDFTPSVYVKNVTFVNKTPYFFSGTIFENLKMLQAGPRQIYKLLKKLAVYSLVMELPQGINTPIGLVNSEYLLYMLSLIRALLSGSEVIIFNDLPYFSNSVYTKKVLKNIEILAKTQTVVIVSCEAVNVKCKSVVVK